LAVQINQINSVFVFVRGIREEGASGELGVSRKRISLCARTQVDASLIVGVSIAGQFHLRFQATALPPAPVVAT
jgi:hypothetical protein